MHDLLIKYVFGETTPSESAEVRRWLQSDPANRKLYEQYKAIWEMGRKTASREADVAGPAETREAWRMMSARLGRGDTAKVEERGIKDSPRSWLRMAAVMVGLLLLGAGGYKLLLNRQPTPTKAVAVA